MIRLTIFRERDKYFNHKKPQRPDVTKIKSPDEPLAKIARLAKDKRKERDDTDHVAEITQLKEKIASMQKTIAQKNSELTQKQAEMTAMQAKLFNEEKIIKEKMKKMQKAHDDKSASYQQQIQTLQLELAKAKRDASKNNSVPMKKKELFPGAKKKDLISTSSYRPKDQDDAKDKKSKKGDRHRGSERGTDSPATIDSRSQSASPAPGGTSASASNDKTESRQQSRSRSRSGSRSRSRSKSIEQGQRSRSSSPLGQTNHHVKNNLNDSFGSDNQITNNNRENSQVQSRSSSPEPMDNGDRNEHQTNYAQEQQSRSISRSVSRSRSRSVSASRSRSRSPSSQRSRNSSPNSSP